MKRIIAKQYGITQTEQELDLKIHSLETGVVVPNEQRMAEARLNRKADRLLEF